ncbi:MAG: TIGR04372 family glycosyltransferase [Chloroflexi bacterium]|nr:TIGR04372 family glycosyltransferase [Chloroflexota bacterium]
MVFRKTKRVLQILLGLPLHVFAIPVVLILRLIRPWLLVRWVGLISSRIGHFAGNTELYFCERDAGINVPKQRHVDLFYMAYKPICNQQLARMWRRVLRVWPSWILAPISRVNRLIPGGALHEIGNNTQNDRDVHNLFESSAPHLKMNEEEEKIAYAEILKMGIPQNAKYVCFHAREPAYLETIYHNGDYSYHNYRDSDIYNFVHAAELLAEQGYYVIRMGAVVREKLKISNDRIIDYSANGKRTDFMDIYLGAKCFFYLGNPDGLSNVPMIFRRPAAMIDVVPMEYIISWGSNNLTILKKYWLRGERRFMTFREILDSGAGRFLHTEEFDRCGIELIGNTPEEIAALAIEMDERLKGTWQTLEEDEILQRRFWEIFPKDAVDAYQGRPLHGEIRARIGAEFLRQHRDWLE